MENESAEILSLTTPQFIVLYTLCFLFCLLTFIVAVLMKKFPENDEDPFKFALTGVLIVILLSFQFGPLLYNFHLLQQNQFEKGCLNFTITAVFTYYIPLLLGIIMTLFTYFEVQKVPLQPNLDGKFVVSILIILLLNNLFYFSDKLLFNCNETEENIEFIINFFLTFISFLLLSIVHFFRTKKPLKNSNNKPLYSIQKINFQYAYVLYGNIFLFLICLVNFILSIPSIQSKTIRNFRYSFTFFEIFIFFLYLICIFAVIGQQTIDNTIESTEFKRYYQPKGEKDGYISMINEISWKSVEHNTSKKKRIIEQCIGRVKVSDTLMVGMSTELIILNNNFYP